MRILLGFWLCCVGLGLCEFPSPIPAFADDGLQEVTIMQEGRERSFLLHVPPNIPESAGAPLLLFLHGGRGNATQAAAMSGFVGLAEREGWLSAFPNGIDHSWNDGRYEHISGHRDTIDDVAFIDQTIVAVAARHKVNRSHIFVAGVSNGGMMAMRLACERSQTFAGIAAVIASLPEALKNSCRPQQPVSVLMINGTADPLVPYKGGEVHFGRKLLGRVLPVEDTVSFWAKNNGCRPDPERSALNKTVPTDVTSVTHLHYRDCKQQSTTEFYRIENGGHTWPGFEPKTLLQRAFGNMLGNKSKAFDASETITEFFAERR